MEGIQNIRAYFLYTDFIFPTFLRLLVDISQDQYISFLNVQFSAHGDRDRILTTRGQLSPGMK